MELQTFEKETSIIYRHKITKLSRFFTAHFKYPALYLIKTIFAFDGETLIL